MLYTKTLHWSHYIARSSDFHFSLFNGEVKFSNPNIYILIKDVVEGIWNGLGSQTHRLTIQAVPVWLWY